MTSIQLSYWYFNICTCILLRLLIFKRFTIFTQNLINVFLGKFSLFLIYLRDCPRCDYLSVCFNREHRSYLAKINNVPLPKRPPQPIISKIKKQSIEIHEQTYRHTTEKQTNIQIDRKTERQTDGAGLSCRED